LVHLQIIKRGGYGMFLKRFARWITKRSVIKQKQQNWSKYFYGQFKI